jgi:endonuclease/exonuclease/phosphatase family metal-dependent hydrolase
MSGTVRAGSFNIRYATPEEGADDWAARRGRLVDLVGELHLDVVGFQEVRPGQYEYLREQLPRYGWIGRGRRGGDEGEHVVVAYRTDRFAVADTGTFWLSETPGEPSTGWDADCPRIASWARLRLLRTEDETAPATGASDSATVGASTESDCDGTFTVFSTHLDHVGARARREGAALLAERVARRVEPTVVVGDLNAPPGTEPIDHLTGDGTGLQVARTVADDVYGPAETYHAFEGEPRERVDYVLADEAFDVARAGTVRTDRPYPSDHYPVVADLEL